MSRDRAASINNIVSKYGNQNRAPSLYPSAIPVVEVIPASYQDAPESRIEAVRSIKYFDKQTASKSGLPKWVFILIGVLVLAGIVGGIYYFYNRQTQTHEEGIEPIYQKPRFSKQGELICEKGFVEFEGKCVGCPAGSAWNGNSCVVRKHQRPKGFQPHELAEFIHKTYNPTTFGFGHSHRHSNLHKIVDQAVAHGI